MKASLSALVVSLALCGFETGGDELELRQAQWQPWSPRPELAPEFKQEELGDRVTLKVDADEKSDFGAWRAKLTGLPAGKVYEFRAAFKATRIENEHRSVIGRLEWFNAKGQPVRPPEYAANRNGEAVLITRAPDDATSLDLQLSLGFTEGAVTWEIPRLTVLSEFPARNVRVATVHHRPRGTKSAQESVEQFCRILESEKPAADIICLPEGISVVGTSQSYASVSESIPGPTTDRLGAVARKLNSYLVAGIYERAGKLVYNTAVLIGRDGKVQGTYRKTHLPREEWEAGITPGDDYPVFKTDFGTVGLLVCWDLQFPEPWRALGQKGAEMVLLPIWGGNETLAKARALENQIFLVSSSYDMRTFVVDPIGEIVAEGTSDRPLAVTELDLARVYYQPWLGNMKTRTWKERRPDISWLNSP